MGERTLSQEQPVLLSTGLNIDLNIDPNIDMNEEPSSRKRKIGPSVDFPEVNHKTTNICKNMFLRQKSNFLYSKKI